MVDYATVTDLQSRWRELEPEEQNLAAQLITDASVQLRREVPGLPAAILADTTGDLALSARRVVCAMVRRAMAVGDDQLGVTSTQEAQGPFSRSLNYSNPMGDLYTTKQERRLLGGGQQRAFTIDTAPPPAPPWWEPLP